MRVEGLGFRGFRVSGFPGFSGLGVSGFQGLGLQAFLGASKASSESSWVEVLLLQAYMRLGFRELLRLHDPAGGLTCRIQELRA